MPHAASLVLANNFEKSLQRPTTYKIKDTTVRLCRMDCQRTVWDSILTSALRQGVPHLRIQCSTDCGGVCSEDE